MRLLRIADSAPLTGSCSTLDNSLLRIAKRHGRPEAVPAKSGSDWEARRWRDLWDANHVQISQRLTLIEAELDRLSQVADEPQPRLSIFPNH